MKKKIYKKKQRMKNVSLKYHRVRKLQVSRNHYYTTHIAKKKRSFRRRACACVRARAHHASALKLSIAFKMCREPERCYNLYKIHALTFFVCGSLLKFQPNRLFAIQLVECGLSNLFLYCSAKLLSFWRLRTSEHA